MRAKPPWIKSLAVQVGDDGVTLGASVTLTRIMEGFKQLIATLPPHKVRLRSAELPEAVQLSWPGSLCV
jgi:hypothetical protein